MLFGPSEGEQWSKDVFFLKYERYVFFYILLVHNSSFFFSKSSKAFTLFVNYIIHSNCFTISEWLKSPSNSSLPARIDQIWKLRAIYHQFDGIFAWRWGWSLVYLSGNEVAWPIVNKKKLLQKTKKELNFWLLKLNGRNTGISKHLLDLLWGLSARNDIFFISWNHTGYRPKFWKKKNYKEVACNELKIFWVSNKTIKCNKLMHDPSNEILHNSGGCEKKAHKKFTLLGFKLWPLR